MGKLEDLEVLQGLKDSGAITPDEFEKVKNKILADDVEVIDTNNQIKEDVKPIDNKEIVTNQVKEYVDIKDTLDNKVDTSKKGTITIKFNHLITAIVLGIVAIIFVVCININKEKDIISPEQNSNIPSNNNKVEVQKTDNKLSIIDEENKELKINANELMNAIITANKVKAENDRSMYFEYTRKLLSSIGKYNTYGVRKFRYTWYIDRLSIFNC